jgi:hypothetical protein
MAEISILLKKETIFAYGESRKTTQFVFSCNTIQIKALQNLRFRESIYLKTQEAYVN